MEKPVQDFRFALRTLSRAPGFSIVVILSVALGFASNATVFSVANGLLWSVLPVKDPVHVLMFSEGSSCSYQSLILPRISALLFGIFGVVGLTLAAIGLYGVMSYSVRRRTREIGIRIALGAKPHAVLGMILFQGLVLTSIGLGIGTLIALALGRITTSVLYGVSGTDPLTFAIVSVVLLSAASVAILVPAFRAAHVEPTTALRYE